MIQTFFTSRTEMDMQDFNVKDMEGIGKFITYQYQYQLGVQIKRNL